MLKKLLALFLIIGLVGLTTGCPSKEKDKKTKEKDTTTDKKAKEGEKTPSLKVSAKSKDTVLATKEDDGKTTIDVTVTGENLKDEEVKVELSGVADPVKATSTSASAGKPKDGKIDKTVTFELTAPKGTEFKGDKAQKLTITAKGGGAEGKTEVNVTAKKD